VRGKGFYKEAGLDVTIKPAGPDVRLPFDCRRWRHVVVDWNGLRLVVREKGVPLVNSRRRSRSRLMLTFRAETGIRSPLTSGQDHRQYGTAARVIAFPVVDSKLGYHTEVASPHPGFIKLGFSVRNP